MANKTPENTVKNLNLKILELEKNLQALGTANNCLSAKHDAILECITFMIAQPEKAKNAPMLCATFVYDSINLALEDIDAPETYKTALREETDVFFSRINRYKNLAQNQSV